MHMKQIDDYPEKNIFSENLDYINIIILREGVDIIRWRIENK